MQVVLAVSAQIDPATTLANYTMMANESLDKFDELLTRQGNRNPPAAKMYSALMASD